MAITLTTDLLADLGYGALTIRQARELLQALYETGEALVGSRLAHDMSNEQLDAFEKFIDNRDDAGALAWLQRNFPEYRRMVRETFDELEDELRDVASGVRRTYTAHPIGRDPGDPAPPAPGA